jgi:ribonuclease J
MKIQIFRGTEEIGGTCIHLSSGDTSIALDMGMPLTSTQSNGFAKNETPAGTMNTDYIKTRFDAVIISHSHQDHYGLIEELPKHTPVYINKVQLDMINASRIFRGMEPLQHHFVFYDIAKCFTIGSFTFHPYLVDHSAPNAFAFLIECEGKRLFYSGDFRAHGRKNGLFEKHLRTPHLKNCDLMFLEGTMINRDNDEYPTEEAVQQNLTGRLSRHDGTGFLISSAQNIDRLTSAFKACHDTARELVVDFYTAWVLYLLKDISKNCNYMVKNIRTLSDGRISGNQYKYMQQSSINFKNFTTFIYANRPLKFDDLNKDPRHYLVALRMYGLKHLKYFTNPLVIYSQWQGYLDEPEYAFARQIKDKLKDKWVYAHTSGHAVKKDLKRFVDALKPKIVVPVHTEHPKRFENVFGGAVNVNIFNGHNVYKI